MADDNKGPVVDHQSFGEEIANSVIHGIGAALSVAALVLLVVFAAKQGDAWKIVSLSIFGVSLIILYLMSTLSHAISDPRVKRFFELMDFASIYILIGGTYTPIMLIYLRGQHGWTMFGVIWGFAILGILSKIFLLGKWDFMSVVFYILMGWGLVLVFKPLIQNAPMGLLKWIAAGGLCYTFGTFFYLYRKMPYHHPVWHLFVLAGSTCHFFGFLLFTVR